MGFFSNNNTGGNFAAPLRIEDVVSEDGDSATFKVASESIGELLGEQRDLQSTVDELSADVGGFGSVATVSEAIGPVVTSVPVIGPDGDEGARLLVALYPGDVIVVREAGDVSNVERLTVAEPGAPAGSVAIPVEDAVATFGPGATVSLGAGVVLGVVRSYEMRIADNESEIETVVNRTATVEGSLGQLGARVTEAETSVTQNADELTSLATRTTTVEGDVATVQTSVTQNADEITTLATRTDTVEGSVGELGDRVTSAETSVSQTADELTSLATRTDTVEGDVATVQTSVTQNADEITTLATRTDTVEGSVGELGDRVTSAETSVSQTADELTSLATRTDTVEGDVATVQTSVTQNADEITTLATRTDTVEGSVGELGDRVTSAETSVSQTADELTSLATRTDTVEGDVATVQTSVTQNADEITTLATRTDTVEGSVGELGDRVTSAETSVSQTADELTSLATRTDTVEGDVATVQTSVTQNADELTSLATRTATVEGDVATVQTSVTQNADELTSLATRTDTVEGDVASVQTSVMQNATAISSKVEKGGEILSELTQSSDGFVYEANVRRSADYVPGVSGNAIHSDTHPERPGLAEFSNAIVRGELYSADGTLSVDDDGVTIRTVGSSGKNITFREADTDGFIASISGSVGTVGAENGLDLLTVFVQGHLKLSAAKFVFGSQAPDGFMHWTLGPLGTAIPTEARKVFRQDNGNGTSTLMMKN